MAVNDQAAFVLVRTKAAGNIGAAARALANMGFADLRLVAPDASSDRVASEMAAHGREVLHNSGVYPDLEAALHDCVVSIGTTCRPGLYRSGAQPLRQTITELTQRNFEGRIAFIFGPEDYGLSNDDLRYCQRLITIPTAPEYTSINLAQSVMLVAYELFIAGSGAAAQREPSLRDSLTAPAPVPEIEMMLSRLEKALVAIGFLAADSTERIMFALRGVFGRSELNRRELDILNGIAHQVGWFAEGGREVIEAKHRSGRKIR
jgi:tRNA/rRNA methyltransferase